MQGGDVQALAAKRLGCKVKQAWGMTELSPAAAVTGDDEYEQFETKVNDFSPSVVCIEISF